MDKSVNVFHYFLSFDLIFVCESWLKPDRSFIYSLPGFVYFNFCRRGISRRARRGAGGLVVYVREELSRGIEFVHSKKMEDRPWLPLQTNMFNLY